VGFHPDEEGDWVADLSCLHGQHVRHRPPFFDRAWVLDDRQRHERIGTELDCPLCDRTELPAGLVLARTAGPFDAETLPEGLRRRHAVARGRWGVLRVRAGRVSFELDVDPPLHRVLGADEEQAIPPEVPHLVGLGPGADIEIDFLVPP
jgi:tellurite resistance-related uncharacterized protein